ncbi:LysR substrate-binding domain-containing protein [Streptomyces sp. NPDC001642]|uniref:LysR family transcriptional regulator n=1 Tax=Streptomyces sp. NPDC001642 TaxID=3154392 RepID=UPI00333362E7
MKLNRIDLNLLVALDALLTDCSVTLAAKRMSIGQPAMSAALARLRRLFDDPLLVRQGSGLVPTPLAESLVAPVRECLASVESIVSVRGSFRPASDVRRFTVLASDYVLLVLLRSLFAELATQAPGLLIHVMPIPADHLDRLRDGRADLLIIPREIIRDAGARFPHTALFTDRHVCAVAADNPDVGDTISLDQFSALPYLAYQAGAPYSLVESQLDVREVPRSTKVATETFALAPFLLTGTRLITLLYERLARQVAEQARIRLLESPIELPPITEAMYWAPRNTQDAGHLWLRERILAHANGL